MIDTIKTNLYRFKQADALIQIESTIKAMRQLAYFQDPDVPYDIYDVAIDNFSKTLVKSIRGSVVDTSVKDEYKKIVYGFYKTQGFYVIRKCKGNLEMLLASNYKMARKKKRPTKDIFQVLNGKNKGNVLFIIKSVPKFRSFLIEYRLVSETTPNKWEICKVIGSCKGNKSGFVVGLEYDFRVKAIFRKTEGTWLATRILRIG